MKYLVTMALLCLCFVGCRYSDLETHSHSLQASPDFKTGITEAVVTLKYTLNTVSYQEGLDENVESALQAARNSPVAVRSEVETRIQKNGMAEMVIKKLEVPEKYDNYDKDVPADDFNYTHITRIYNSTAYMFDAKNNYLSTQEIEPLNYTDILIHLEDLKKSSTINQFLTGQLFDVQFYLKEAADRGATIENIGEGLFRVTEGSPNSSAFRTTGEEDFSVVNVIDAIDNLLVASRVYGRGKLISQIAYKFIEQSGGMMLDMIHQEDYYHSEATDSDYKVITNTYFENIEFIDNLN